MLQSQTENRDSFICDLGNAVICSFLGHSPALGDMKKGCCLVQQPQRRTGGSPVCAVRGPERPENSPVDYFQRRPGGSPGQGKFPQGAQSTGGIFSFLAVFPPGNPNGISGKTERGARGGYAVPARGKRAAALPEGAAVVQ